MSEETEIVLGLDDLRVDSIAIHVSVAGLPKKIVKVKPLTYHEWQMTGLDVPEPQAPDKWDIVNGKQTKIGKNIDDPDYLRKRQDAHMERQYRRLIKSILGVPDQFDDLRSMSIEEQIEAIKTSAFMGYVLPILAKLSQIALEGHAKVDTLAATFPAIPSDSGNNSVSPGKNAK